MRNRRPLLQTIALLFFLLTPALALAQAFPPMEVVPDDSPGSGSCPNCLIGTTGQTTFTFRLGQTVTEPSTPPGAQVVSLYLSSITGSGLAFNRLVLTHGFTTTDVFDAYANGTLWYPTALAPMTFPFAGQSVSGAWNMLVIETAIGSNPQLTVTMVINWQIPATPPPPPSPATMQGYKLDIHGNQFPNAVISVDGQSTGGGNPYGISLSPNQAHQAVSSVPGGYWVAHSACLNCTNHPDSSWAYGNTFSQYLHPGDSADVWWKYIPVSTGYLDTSVSTDGGFSGWAYDPYSPAVSISVDVYLDGPAGSGTFVARVTANGSRPDVDNAFGITGDHGFSFALPAQYLGANHWVYVHAIGLNGHDNPLIAHLPGQYLAPAPPPPPPPPPPTCRSGYHDCGDGVCVRAPAVCP